MKHAVISASSNGNNTVVAAVTGKRIRVLGYVLSFSGTVNAKWNDGVNDLSGLLYGLAGGSVVAPAVPPVVGAQPGWLTTSAQGAALILVLSAGVAVGGHVLYDLVP